MVKHILLVDDNPNDLELALVALQQEAGGPQVTVAQGGPEALAYLNSHREEQAGRPDLVLLDLKMPQMDGLEVLEAIRGDAGLRGIPVVMLTTSRSEADIQACKRRGASGYVVKPLDFAAFTETLRATLAFWTGPGVTVPLGLLNFACR